MKVYGGRSAPRLLVLSVAVLLVAGVLAATMAGPPASTSIAAGGRAGAASIAADALPADEAPTTTAAVPTTTVLTTVAPATTITARSSTTARATPRTTATTVTAPTTTARPPAAAVTTTTIKPQQTTWHGEDRGFTVRWTMQPTAPRAGEPVTFTVSMSQFHGCCIASVLFDDGERTSPLEVYSRCDDTGTTRGATTRTFAAPGYYGIYLSGQTFPCAPEDGLAPTDPMDPRSMRGLSFRSCIEVAAAPGGQAAAIGRPGCPVPPLPIPFS